MNIQEIMSTPAVVCRPSDTLSRAAQLMWEHDYGCLPVVDDQGSVIGMLTDRDTCMAAYTRGEPLHAISVESAMARKVFVAHSGDSLESVERLMAEKQIRRLPVVDRDQRPIGLLSLNDLARHVTTARKKDGLEHELAETLAAIGRPHSRGVIARPLPSGGYQDFAAMR